MKKDQESVPDFGAEALQPEDNAPDLAEAARKSAGKAAWMGTAVGIGSAAIVAALLYTSKSAADRRQAGRWGAFARNGQKGAA
ncbi:hypothetical protein ACFSUK_10465 [Sphingobium scionense]